jgi:hypothetical protein
LGELGLSNDWLSQAVPSPLNFKSLVKSKLRDQFIQSWTSDVQSLIKCLNYRLYKPEFVFEDYFKILSWQLSSALLKVKRMNHKVSNEKGRFLNSIDKILRISTLYESNQLSDEFYHLFHCSHFVNSRREFFKPYCYRYPNAMKSEDLMNSINKSH